MNRKEFIASIALATGFFFLPGVHFFNAEKPHHILKETTEREIIIIGSGYGGAVAALRLCERGYKVTLLEMGLDWQKAKEPFSPMIKPGKSAAWLKNKTIAPFFNIFSLPKFTGVLDRMDFDDIKIWIGRGVGGGSLVNGGMAVTPKQDYFKEIFPNLDAQAFYQKYFPLANKELGTNLPSETFLEQCEYYTFSKVAEKEAQKAGFATVRVPNVYDFQYMEKEYKQKVPRSALAGEVIYGNNHGKKTLMHSYLKKALDTGNLEIWDLHQVHSIEKNEHYTLHVSQIDTQGKIQKHKEIHCKTLFLAAGTMGTLELLLKSNAKHKLPIDHTIGKEWGNNGNFMTGRNFVKAFEGGTGTESSTIPVGGIDNWEDEKYPFFTEIAPLPMGMNTATSLYLMINKLKKFGEVGYDTQTEKLLLHWDKSHTKHMKDNAKYMLKRLNKANGGTRSHMLFHNGFGHDICYHPLGGVVLGKSTNSYGKLNLHDSLYVIDGSLIPGTIGVNPFVTITAIAEYCMEHILENDFAYPTRKV